MVVIRVAGEARSLITILSTTNGSPHGIACKTKFVELSFPRLLMHTFVGAASQHLEKGPPKVAFTTCQ